MTQKPVMHSAHWGAFHVQHRDDQLLIEPFHRDPDPSPLLQNFRHALNHPARVAQPMIRRGWLENGPGPDQRRGADEYVAVSWEEASQRVAQELKRVGEAYGPEGIFGGSYGWSSAGRFHHAQSQVHRFLNTTLGGYVRSVNSYSSGAASVLLPHIVGDMNEIARRGVSWEEIAAHSEVVLAFGGLALKNAQVASGGLSEHTERGFMQRAAQRGTRFISVSPLKSDLPEEAQGEWLALRPGTDAAFMLGLLAVLIAEALTDEAFLARYCIGWPQMVAYIRGEEDGVVRDAHWAAGICGVSSDLIGQFARQLHGKRVLVTVAHALQRAEHGEQPVWLGLVLAAALGQPGLPGGGYTYALGALGHYGKHHNLVSFPALPQGKNGIDRFIPVARIADMLLNPGGHYAFDGQQRIYPDIRLVYWAGGNVFHHHQDINKLIRAWQQPDTVIVHEQFWTAQARFADIVLPATTSLEREDIGSASNDGFIIAMQQHLPPFGAAKSDYAIFAELAQRLGFADVFTQGRDERQWLEAIYADSRPRAAAQGIELPPFEAFWSQGVVEYPAPDTPQILLKAFRDNPESDPLSTPSGKIELFSQRVADFGYEEAPGFAFWYPPEYQAQQQEKQQWPLHLLSSQPRTRLHSQYDHGRVSRATKIAGREPLWMHPEDAAARGIEENSIVKVFNGRGALLAGVHLTQDILPGVVQMSTGAWYDPLEQQEGKPLDKHGNPNVLTQDRGSSRLGQGCSAQTCFVEIALYHETLPEITAWSPPEFVIPTTE